jgi:hypothetical protein
MDKTKMTMMAITSQRNCPFLHGMLPEDDNACNLKERGGEGKEDIF